MHSPHLAENTGGLTDLGMLADGDWHRFTFHLKVESAPGANDGLIRGWIDGVERWSYLGIGTGGSSPMYTFKVPTTFNLGSPQAQSEWMDDFTVWR